MTQFSGVLSFRVFAAAAFLALALSSSPTSAATLTVSGSGLSAQGGSSVCTYTAMSESSAGNWTVACGTGSRAITISPALNGTVCESYASMSESSTGDWTVQGCGSLAPAITLDAPSQSGLTYPTGTPFTLRATATAPGGRSISAVEFYAGATLIHAGTLSGSQYIWDWSPAAGTYQVFARVTDNTGATADSVSRQMTFQQSAVVYYIHPDHLGTPRAITRPSDNQVIWRWDDTEPFGNSNANENPAGLGAFAFNLRLPGQYSDGNSGTHYNYFRDYDPQIGRFVQGDPIGLAAGLSVFGYVGGRPNKRIDPMGLWSTPGHNYFIDEFFGNLAPNVIEQIKAGSRYADMLKFQGDCYSFMHAMSSDCLPAAVAKQKYCEYIKTKMGYFNQDRDSKDQRTRDVAYFNLGMAMHAVMDSTSPPHKGFQHWSGSEWTRHALSSSEETLDIAKEHLGITWLKMKQAYYQGQLMECECQ